MRISIEGGLEFDPGAKTPWHTMIHDDLSHHESSLFAADSFC
jgi:hypothetical protein